MKVLNEPVAPDAEIEAYLEKHGRSKDALISAGLLTSDHNLLKEAADRFPDDPMVQFLVVSNDLFPEKRREWAEKFMASEPDNALAAYLMADEYFKEGETEEATAVLTRGVGMSDFKDFSKESMFAMETAALELGAPVLESKVRSTLGLPVPWLSQLRKTANQLMALQREASSAEQAEELSVLGVAIGNGFSEGSGSQFTISKLTGLSIERQFLQRLAPSLESPFLSRTPEALLADIEAEKQRISESVSILDSSSPNYSAAFEQLDPAMAAHYLDRVRFTGELEANKWLEDRLDKR